MYTEDDEKVKVKNDNSNNDESDFYTSFNEIGNEEDTKKKKKTTSKKKEKEQEDYSDFYGKDDDEEDNSDNKGRLIKIALFIFVAIIVISIVIIIIAVSKGSSKGDIKLSTTEYTLKAGETDYISYEIVDTESDVVSTFRSSDENVAVVDNNGQITAIGNGEATITISYTIEGKTKEKTCKVVVSGGSEVSQDITLNLELVDAKVNEWTNKDVIVNVDAKSAFGISSIRYGLNCDSNCDYSNVSDNKFTISSNGITKVKVIALDKKGQEATKEITIKIDKEDPKVTYNGKKTIVSNSNVEVCVTCSDSISGCKQNKVCKKYTETKSNQSITVYDKAGNKKSSSTFNVQVNKVKQPCSLKVSSDGTVTATIDGEAEYYGFNSKYTGDNEISKKVEIYASRKGESGAKVVHYYVKTKNGNTGNCYITVVKECNCTDKNSTAADCPVTCTFRKN